MIMETQQSVQLLSILILVVLIYLTVDRRVAKLDGLNFFAGLAPVFTLNAPGPRVKGVGELREFPLH
jgi:hypothetical protein